MTNVPVPESVLSGYLLGDLSPEEQSDLELRYGADEATFRAVQEAETELVDRYAREELGRDDRHKFETSLLAIPRIRERVHFARELAHRADQQPRRVPRPLLGLAPWLAAASLLVAVGAWLAMEAARIRSTHAALRSESIALREEVARLKSAEGRQASQLAELRSEVELLRKRPPTVTPGPSVARDRAPAGIVTLVLASSILREDENPNRLEMPPGTEALLKLPIEGQAHGTFRVTLRDLDGRALLDRTSLRAAREPSGAYVVLRLPASTLPSGDYFVSMQREPADERPLEFPLHVTQK